MRALVPPAEYQMQGEFQAVIQPSFIMPILKTARRDRLSLVMTHTHPFATAAKFSFVDDDGERILMPVLFARTGNGVPHGAFLVTPSDQCARIWKSTESRFDAEIVEIGKEVRINRHISPQELPCASEFDRSVRAFGIEGQATLSSITVAIVGLGGMGSIVAEQLSYLGVQSVILIDPDVVETTNLNRVVGADSKSVGLPKTDVAARQIQRVRPTASIKTIQGDVQSSAIGRQLLDADFIFCCTDSHGSRAVLNQLAYQYLIPTIDLGVRVQVANRRVESIVGRVQMLAPGLPCLVCQRLLDPEEVRRDLLSEEDRKRDPYIVGSQQPQPAVVSLNGTVASLGITMMLSAVTGLPVAPRHQVVRFDRGVVRAVASEPQPDCVVCSLRGALARGDSWPMPGRPI